MRAYFFGNLYLSSIQQGIQAAHVVGEMFINYPTPTNESGEVLWDWVKNHKTMILLNGGYQDTLKEIQSTITAIGASYPYAHFCEEKASLNEAMTSVGIVLPDSVYDMKAIERVALRKKVESNYDSLLQAARYEQDFSKIERLKLLIMGFDLAR